MQETHTYSKSAKEEHIEGWLSRYQVAAEEKLPPDSALLQELLDQLPIRAHRAASWVATGEKEYYYQAQGQIALSASTDHQLMAIRQGKITQVGFDQLTERGPEHEKPQLALQDDDKKEKTEPKEEKEVKAAQFYKDTLMKLKKLSKQMVDLAHDAVVHRTKLQEKVDSGKTYLQPLLDLMVQQVTSFQEATNTAISHSATGCEPSAIAAGVLEKQFQEAKSHYQAFKLGPYNEMVCIL